MARLQPQSVSLAIYFLCNMTYCFVVVIMLAQLYSTPILNQMRPLQNSYPKICSLHYFFVPLWYETNSFFSQFCRCRSRSA